MEPAKRLRLATVSGRQPFSSMTGRGLRQLDSAWRMERRRRGRAPSPTSAAGRGGAGGWRYDGIDWWPSVVRRRCPGRGGSWRRNPPRRTRKEIEPAKYGVMSVATSCGERMHEIVVEEVGSARSSGSDDAERWMGVMERSFARMDAEAMSSKVKGQ
ncbi:hypothetical protein TRIUR3_04458 [Triticum urartu]|uniref:Uncharacterized protein n=1 Tax=Triticum urartu TaxID=4572 RepID=M7ZGR1_TRIUA|nr:hypothetical protein TRIUR3_04458 [Triticum urartu]